MKILLFNINGSGLGHMNRCLAYAQALQDKADIFFFSLASACEIIESYGFQAEYFVSPFWSGNNQCNWEVELAQRFGQYLTKVRPDAIVFDGTWPYAGFLSACKRYAGNAALVWSRRGLMRQGVKQPKFDRLFDLVLEPGELDGDSAITLLRQEEILSREEARTALGLRQDGKYALFSLGPGNLKDISSVGNQLLQAIMSKGYTPCWAVSPITVKDIVLPSDVRHLVLYPISKYLRAFDIFVGAAGYNTCCEVTQAQVPSLLVPNTLLADDQTRRANMVARIAPAVVSPCETEDALQYAVAALCELAATNIPSPCPLAMGGAQQAAEAILDVATKRCTRHRGVGSLYAAGIDALARVGAWFYKLGLRAWPAWSAALKHGLEEHGRTIYIQDDVRDKNQIRQACNNIKAWLTDKSYIPVLETGMSDFAFYSRLGWLVEYLPDMKDNDSYVAQKKDYLAWRYRGAVCVPLSSGLGSEQAFSRFIQA